MNFYYANNTPLRPEWIKKLAGLWPDLEHEMYWEGARVWHDMYFLVRGVSRGAHS